MNQVIEKFVKTIKDGQTEIYNEFSLQHELGLFLRSQYSDWQIRFERNVSFFFKGDKFVKKEIDISVFSPDKTRLRCAIELKFPRNGQHPEQMFSFCKDMLFVEQLKKAGFEQAYLIVFVDDPLFYSGNGEGIYGYFRKQKRLCGSIQKPTGAKDESVKLGGTYSVVWKDASEDLKYCMIKASSKGSLAEVTD